MEQLQIVNFGSIKDATYMINQKLTVIIGPEASGKSITAKLLYFFKSSLFDSMIMSASELSYEERVCDRFYQFFPQAFWAESHFEITYRHNDWQFKVQGNKHDGCTIKYPEKVVSLANQYITKIREQEDAFDAADDEFVSVADIVSDYNNKLEKLGLNRNSQVFVIAARSILAMQQDLAMQLATNNPHSLDIVAKGFVNMYSALKKMQTRLKDEKLIAMTDNILRAKYINAGGVESLVYPDNRKVEISSVSSGQQEVLPLVLILRSLPLLVSSHGKVTLYIEEPEAHLFPASQKAIVETVAYLVNTLSPKLQVIVTTHSPYILASFNNLIQASDSVKNGADEVEVNRIIPKSCHINYPDITAYSMHDGSIENLMDDEMHLIGETALDAVADTISAEFANLLEI